MHIEAVCSVVNTHFLKCNISNLCQEAVLLVRDSREESMQKKIIQ